MVCWLGGRRGTRRRRKGREATGDSGAQRAPVVVDPLSGVCPGVPTLDGRNATALFPFSFVLYKFLESSYITEDFSK